MNKGSDVTEVVAEVIEEPAKPRKDPASMSLAEILYDIQQKLVVKRTLNNTYAGFMYRNIEQINAEVKGLLADYPNVVLRYHDEPVLLNDWHYIKSTCSLERGDERISETGWARESEHKSKFDDAQVTGSSSSYARKYAAQALFAIEGERDADDHGNNQIYPQANQQPAPQPTYQQPQAQPPTNRPPNPPRNGQQQRYRPSGDDWY